MGYAFLPLYKNNIVVAREISLPVLYELPAKYLSAGEEVMHATYHQLKEIKGDRHFLMRDEKGVLLLLLSIFQRRRKTSPTTNGAHKFCCFCVVRVCACACVCVCVNLMHLHAHYLQRKEEEKNLTFHH